MPLSQPPFFFIAKSLFARRTQSLVTFVTNTRERARAREIKPAKRTIKA